MFDIKEEQVQNRNLVLLAKKRMLNVRSMTGSLQQEKTVALQYLFAVEDKNGMGKYKLLSNGQVVTTRNNGSWESDYAFVAKGLDIEKALQKHRSRLTVLMGMEQARPITELIKALNNNKGSVNSRFLASVEKTLVLNMKLNAQLSNIGSSKRTPEQGMGLD